MIKYLLSPISLDSRIIRSNKNESLLLQYKNFKYLQKRLQFLFIESNPVLELSLRKITDRLGFRTDFVNSETKALELLKTHRYDMIIVDWDTSIMTGKESVYTIRSVKNGLKVPIIALSNNTAIVTQTECEELEVCELLKKPLESIHLVTAIEKHVS